MGREGEEVVSKPMVSTFQTPPLRLAPVYPSRPDRSFILEVEMPKVLTEAETSGREPYSQTLKKTEAPMGRNRLSSDSISELPPIPTVESPSIPEQKEMILAAPVDLHQGQMTKLETSRSLQIPVPMKRNRLSTDFISELPPIPTVESPSIPEQKETILTALDDFPQGLVDRFETARKPQPIEKTDLPFTFGEAFTGRPKIMIPKVKPAALDLKISLSYPFPGSAKGAAFLFVLDTSGSVKGSPFKGIKKSALEFVKLMGENDRAGIMTFNDNTKLVSTFTPEKELLERKINDLRTAGKWTVLFDALIEAMDVIKREDRESNFVILFSDGKDEGSRSTLDEVIQRTRQSGVSILCVGYSRVKKKHLDTLRKIAGETGGVFADAPQFHDIVTLYKASRETAAQEGEPIPRP